MADKNVRSVRFETIKSEIKEFGQNNFIEISRNKVISNTGENEFITISRGYYRLNFESQEQEKVYKKSVTVPDQAEMINFVKEHIDKV